MNGSDEKLTQNNTVTFKRPSVASVVIAGILSLFTTSLSALALQEFGILTSVVCFICAGALFSFVLLYVRVFWVCVFPLTATVAAVLAGGSLFLSAAVSCGVTVFAALYAICHVKSMDSFKQFLCVTALFSVLYGIAFVMFLMMGYGSVNEGMRVLRQQILDLKTPVLDLLASRGMNSSEDVALLESLLNFAVVYIPAVICTMGVISAWCMRCFFSLYTRAAGIGSLFDGRQTSAPKPLAVIFVLFGLFGMFFGFLPEGMLLGLSNIISVLSVILFGEGVRLFFAAFSKRAKKRAHPALLIVATVLLCVFPMLIPVILPYYGAFSIIRERKVKTGKI